MTDKTFNLPEKIEDGRLDLILEVFDFITKKTKDRLILNFERTEMISPAGHAILCCLGDSIREQGQICEVVELNIDLASKDFLHKILTNSDSKLLPITQMSHVADNFILLGVEDAISPNFADEVDKKFSNTLSEENLWYVRFITNELIQNAKDHSVSERYFLYAGLQDENLQFGVCDMGVTIPAKLEQKYNCANDEDYLKKSLEFKVGTRRTRPGGLGLNHMFEILKKQKGRLVIVSRMAQLRIYFERRKTTPSVLKKVLRGTWCMARIPMDK